MWKHPALSVLLSGTAMLLLTFRASDAVDCQSSLRLDVGAIYELAGQPTVAVHLTNLLSDQRIMLPREDISVANMSGFVYQVRKLGDRATFAPLPTPEGTSALYPHQHLVVEVRNPFGIQDLKVAFPFKVGALGEPCVTAVEVPNFAARLRRAPIDDEEAVRIAKEGGFPFELDPEWKLEYVFVGWHGRVFELTAHVSDNPATGASMDTVAYVDAFTGAFLGLTSKRKIHVRSR